MRSSSPHLQQRPDLLRIYLPTPSARFNTIISQPLAGKDLERCAAESTAFFAGRARAYTWVMDAAGAAGKAATHEVMQRHGLVGFAERPLMVLPLLCIPQQPRPHNLQIVPVTTVTQIEQFIAVFSQGEPGEGLDPTTLRPLFAPRVGPDSIVRSFLGLIGDRPVACATLVPSGHIAGIYEVATVPAARRQGYGAALILRALSYADRLGLAVSILQSSSAALSLYRRLGYTEFARSSIYLIRAFSHA